MTLLYFLVRKTKLICLFHDMIALLQRYHSIWQCKISRSCENSDCICIDLMHYNMFHGVLYFKDSCNMLGHKVSYIISYAVVNQTPWSLWFGSYVNRESRVVTRKFCVHCTAYTSNGSWRQDFKGEMTCTVYVALVWNITYWMMMIIIIMIIIIMIMIIIIIIIIIMMMMMMMILFTE